MLGQIGINQFNWKFSNSTTPSLTPGTSVVPGASNAEGAWTQVATAANIAKDVYGVWLWVNAGNTTATAKMHLLDVGVDSAGGTAYLPLVSNLQCGQSAAALNGGIFFYLPLFIKAGSAVAVRVQGLQATAGSVRVAATFYGSPSHIELVRAGRYSETIGTIASSCGTSITPGSTAAEGAWVSLGTTTRAMWYWLLSIQCNNGTTTALAYTFDLAYGDATNKHIITQDLQVLLAGTAEQTTIIAPPPFDLYCHVPAGATIYARGSCSGTTATGWTALATGIGG